MVKKLFKHEFLAYGRVMLFLYIILLTIAAATRVVLGFESNTTAYEIISTISLLTYFASIFAAVGFSYVMGIVRFYKNLFSSEGYLSFTLPVTTSQHIGVKTVAAVSVNLLTWVMVLASACIVTSGDVLSEIVSGLEIGLYVLYDYAGIHLVFIGIELFFMLVFASFTSVMLFYTFISIGQLFKKNRILAAVGAYFVYYILTQIVVTVLSFSLSLAAMSGVLEEVAFWIALHPFETIHIVFGSYILLAIIFALIEFLVIHWIITKKLNLE